MVSGAMLDGEVDPDLAAFLELAAASEGRPMHEAGPALARLSYCLLYTSRCV